VLLWGSLGHIVQAYETLSQAMKEAGLQHTGEVRECTYSFESPDSPNNLMGIYMGIG
jgi:effector-binding domain-containing protein